MNKKKKKESRLPFRINIIFFSIFILFSVLVIQLGIVQILEGKSYQEEIDRTISDISKLPVPRGKIYDSNGNVVVDNDPLYAITYTPPKRVQAKEKLKVAKKLTNYITLDKKALKKISERNEKEYWYLENTEKATDRLTEEEEKELDDVEQYNLALKRITDEDLAEISKEDMQVIGIKRELDKAYALTPEVIKNKGISVEEYAEIAEHLSQLAGVNATTDWNRQYLYGDTLKSIIGSITTQDQGIPKEEESYFLTRGYNRNDRVGTSGLEQQYEDLLRGRKEAVQYTTTKSGNVIGSEVITEGERGKDLVLSLDMDFQEKVDDVVMKEFKKIKGTNSFVKDALAVAMNPKTGDILALSGVHYDKEKNEYQKKPLKTLYDSHEPGSSVKGATVMAGLQSEVITPNQVFNDTPIRIAGSNPKGSYTPLGPVNDITALKRSSNVYMFYIGLRMGGDFRYPFPSGSSTSANASEGIQKMRNYFNQFGLGVSTGIDFPAESTGYMGPEPIASDLMDLGIGQYDTYTTMQLAQYVSTIANDGYRVEPHIVKEIRNPGTDDELGSIYDVNHTQVLNKINIDNDYIERVQTGFWKAFNESGGTGYQYWADAPYEAAGKTGTAETKEFGEKDDGSLYLKANTENLSLVGYAPYDDPEIAFAVIVPNLNANAGQGINHAIGRGIMDAYFETKKEDEENENEDE